MNQKEELKQANSFLDLILEKLRTHRPKSLDQISNLMRTQGKVKDLAALIEIMLEETRRK